MGKRELDTATLDLAARQWAAQFLQPSVFSPSNPEVAREGREWVLQSFFAADFKDEFEYLLPKFKAQLGPDALADFEAEAEKRFTPRSDETLAELLAEKLAVTPDGDHIPGKIGTVQLGVRKVGDRTKRRTDGVTLIKDARWPIYAGEDEERAAGSDAPDPLPDPKTLFHGVEHLAPVKAEG